MHDIIYLSIHLIKKIHSLLCSSFHIYLPFNLACLLFCLPSDVRWGSGSPKARRPRQATVPHHHGSYRRRRSLLSGGSLHGCPAQEVTNTDLKTLRNKLRHVTVASHRPLFTNPLATSLFGTCSVLFTCLFCQNIPLAILEITCVFSVKKMFKLINFKGKEM